MKVTKDDKALIKGLIKILNDGTFPLKAKEVGAFAKIYQWVQELDKRFAEDVVVEKPVVKKKTRTKKAS